MQKQYKFYSTDEKKQFAKKFSKEQHAGYIAGKRKGFLEGIQKVPKKKDEFLKHDYSNFDFNSLYDDLDTVKLI